MGGRGGGGEESEGRREENAFEKDCLTVIINDGYIVVGLNHNIWLRSHHNSEILILLKRVIITDCYVYTDHEWKSFTPSGEKE